MDIKVRAPGWEDRKWVLRNDRSQYLCPCYCGKHLVCSDGQEYVWDRKHGRFHFTFLEAVNVMVQLGGSDSGIKLVRVSLPVG